MHYRKKQDAKVFRNKKGGRACPSCQEVKSSFATWVKYENTEICQSCFSRSEGRKKGISLENIYPGKHKRHCNVASGFACCCKEY